MVHGSTTARALIFGLCPLFILSAGCRVLPDKALSVPANETVTTGVQGPPRIRFGCYPSSTVGTFFLGENLGRHGYYYSPFEKDGIAYTCRGGDVDIIHLRIAADWSTYLACETYRHLMRNDAGFTYKLAVDRSRSYVRFTYPSNWRQLSKAERSAKAKEIALAVGPYLTFTMTSWHEILTWFGFRCIGLPTEFPSAFSWEDSYSNLLGTIIAVQALQDKEHTYNRAIEFAIDRELKRLGVQPAYVAKQASQRVKGQWFTGSVLFFVDIKKRNFDIGLDDGFVTPTLLPGVGPCEGAEPLSYPVPSLDALARHGFSLSLEIESKEWERGKIFNVLGKDPKTSRIQPTTDFPILMDYLGKAAEKMYGPIADGTFRLSPRQPSATVQQTNTSGEPTGQARQSGK